MVHSEELVDITEYLVL